MIMPNPERKPKKTNSTPKKRIRLTRKQAEFLHWVFALGATVESAMDNLHIWPSMLDNWLRQPRFNEAIEFKLAQFRLQIRINATLFAPRAVRTLGYMFDTQADFETKRKASVDLLKILDAINQEQSCRKSQVSRVTQAAPGGAQVAHSGAPRAHTGAQGRAAVQENTPKLAPNPRFQLNIAENR